MASLGPDMLEEGPAHNKGARLPGRTHLLLLATSKRSVVCPRAKRHRVQPSPVTFCTAPYERAPALARRSASFHKTASSSRCRTPPRGTTVRKHLRLVTGPTYHQTPNIVTILPSTYPLHQPIANPIHIPVRCRSVPRVAPNSSPNPIHN